MQIIYIILQMPMYKWLGEALMNASAAMGKSPQLRRGCLHHAVIQGLRNAIGFQGLLDCWRSLLC